MFDLSFFMPALLETLYMIVVSTIFTILFGLPLGIILVVSSKGHILQNNALYSVLSYIVNMIRSLPYLILLIVLIPAMRIILGTAIGINAVIVSLIVASVPFFARLVETSLLEVDSGVIEAALSMGATPLQIILRVLIPESMSALMLNITVTMINILGYSAMAGVIGGGGLGDLAIRFGYNGFRDDIIIQTVIILIVVVQLIQTIGNRASKSFK